MYRAIQALGGYRNYIRVVYPPWRTRRRGDSGTALPRACLRLHDRTPLCGISVTFACRARRILARVSPALYGPARELARFAILLDQPTRFAAIFARNELSN